MIIKFVSPEQTEIFAKAAAKWTALRRENDRISRRLWCGTIAENFSEFELQLLRAKGYLSESDEGLIRRIKSA